MKKRLAGLIGISIGIGREISINVKAIYHGHYHKEDLRELEIAEGEKLTGIGLLTNNSQLYEKGLDKIKGVSNYNN